MAGNLLNLAKEIRTLRVGLEEKVNKATVMAADAALTFFAQNIRVDTSKALSNIKIGVGAQPVGVRPPHVEGRGGSTRGASMAATLAEGRARLKSRKFGQPIHVFNDVDYIQFIEDDLERASALKATTALKTSLKGLFK